MRQKAANSAISSSFMQVISRSFTVLNSSASCWKPTVERSDEMRSAAACLPSRMSQALASDV